MWVDEFNCIRMSSRGLLTNFVGKLMHMRYPINFYDYLVKKLSEVDKCELDYKAIRGRQLYYKDANPKICPVFDTEISYKE